MTTPRWSPDGATPFWSTHSHGGTSTQVGRYDSATGAVETTILPVGGSLRSVAVERDLAQSFFPDVVGPPADCPRPAVQPSGRTGTCGFSAVADGLDLTVSVGLQAAG